MDSRELMNVSVGESSPKKSGSPSPVLEPGLTLSWHDLTVWIKRKVSSNWYSSRYEDTKIIRKVSGIAEPGTLLAIMGPSGAGKTTLLATISQRLKGDVKGKVLVNGKHVSKDLMLKISGFVPQHDLVLDSLTVIEHMHLMAKLKMDKQTNAVQRTQRILTLLSELGITKCTHTRMSALSGGQKKRVALAVQLLTDPGILFCDEPTTGLDSYSAASVVEQLRSLAGRGKTVVCTIHQPASGIFDMFHSVYLLVPGGRLALTTSTHLVGSFFASLNLECPPSYNIAEFIVTQLAMIDDVESRLRVSKICREFKSSPDYVDLLHRLQGQLERCPPSPKEFSSLHSVDDEFQKYLKIRPPSRWVQLNWLMWRSVIEMYRNPGNLVLRLCFYLFIALLVATPYIGLRIDQEGIQNMQGFLYLVVVETIFTFTYSVMHTFPAEIPVLLREIGNGLYCPSSYYISKMIMMLPRAIIEPLIFSVLVFYITGLFGGVTGCFQFATIIIACSIVATAYGCLISAVFESVATGSLVSVPFEQITLLFCGIFMSLSDVPLHFAWVKYFSAFYYGLEAVSVLQWSRVYYIPCDERPEVPCIASGREVLDIYGYSASNVPLDLAGLGMLYFLFHTVGFIAFWRRSQGQACY